MVQRVVRILLLLAFIPLCDGLLEQGRYVLRLNSTLKPEGDYDGVSRSAYKGTQVEIRLSCPQASKAIFEVDFTVRSSPCDREFIETVGTSEKPTEKRAELLKDYYCNPQFTQPFFDYTHVWPQRSFQTAKLKCDDNLAVHPYFTEVFFSKWQPMPVDKNLTQYGCKRDNIKAIQPSENETQLAVGHPTFVTPVHAIYLLVFNIKNINNEPGQIQIDIEWKSPHGYLSPVDWPLLPFFGCMCGLYALFAAVWLIISAVQWRELLRIQFWIGGVIVLGMVEAAVFLAEYETLNTTGVSVDYAIQLAEIVSCLKRTVARMLIIIVSVGFGVVRPRLGPTLHKVVGVGFVYFILSSIEGIMRVSKVHVDNQRQKQLIALPLTALEVGICWWIFSSLVNTTRALRLRRNDVKLSLYRHFTNTLIFAVVASVVFMGWSLYMHVFTPCLKDWMELWVDTAFWHLLFAVILLVIMILWRPTINNQRYAFTPLLDSGDGDDDEEDTVFSSEAFMPNSDAMKQRGKKAEPRGKENTLEEELKWVEENIPSSLADKALPALVDSDEEVKQTRFEISKMQ